MQISTPLGNISIQQVQEAESLGVWRNKGSEVSLTPYKTQSSYNRDGRTVSKEVLIPIKFYNLEWALHVNKGDWAKAIKDLKIWQGDHIASRFGFSSYAKMFETVRQN